ncbi:MAG: type II toxin-antitoxin system VapC family toxin [Actinomycetes bacterium]
MNALVVDASVALKWTVTEQGTDDANDLLDNGALLIAPEHLLGEVGNGLRKRVAQGVLGRDEAIAALDAIVQLEIEYVTGAERWARTLRDALAWGVTTYDAIYIAVAVDLGAPLITADRRLLTSATALGLPVLGLGDRGPEVPPARRPS